VKGILVMIKEICCQVWFFFGSKGEQGSNYWQSMAISGNEVL